MKKIILPVLSFFLFCQLHAQTKITKTSVVGKWMIYAVDMPGTMYYSLDKDSLALGDKMKAQVKDAQQLADLTEMMKPKLVMFTKIFFLFNADGTAELDSGTEESTQWATYTVDEENSSITTIENEEKKDTLKADMLEDKLRITINQPQGEIKMILKKVKS